MPRTGSASDLVGSIPANHPWFRKQPSSSLAPGANTASPAVSEPVSHWLAAIAGLAELAGHEADEQLSTIALQHSDAAMRAEAMHALGERRGPVALQVLQRALGDPHQRVRESALHAATNIGGNDAALAVGAAMASGDVAFRLRVVETLGEIGGVYALPYLKQALQDEQSIVREAAAQWLEEYSAANR
jgi:HEAT repeat protein